MTRQDYETYLLYKQFVNDEVAHDYLVKCRKKDRAESKNKSNVKFIYDDNCWEYWVEKTVYSYEFSQEEIEEYIEDNWIRIYSLYDCTGLTFTRDIRCFPINGKTIVYHFKAVDC